MASHATAFDCRLGVFGQLPHEINRGTEEDHHEDMADAETNRQAKDSEENVILGGFANGKAE